MSHTMHFFRAKWSYPTANNSLLDILNSFFLGMCEFTGFPFGGNGTNENTLLNKENIGEGAHTVTVLENDLPLTAKRFK